MSEIRPHHPHDIIVWPNGNWNYRVELYGKLPNDAVIHPAHTEEAKQYALRQPRE